MSAAIPTESAVAIVGAGPAGLGAAIQAADLGVSTVLFDEQPGPGGQIYRGIGRSPLTNRAILGKDYWHGESLVEAFGRSGASYFPSTTVWLVSRDDRGFELGVSTGGASRLVHAKCVILATGAQERPFPIPGWTLPGVMTVGAGQILLKSSGIVPDGRLVLAGCGPLLYLAAWQYLNAGVGIDAILETTPPGRLEAALPHVMGFLGSRYLPKGLKLLREVKRRVRVIRHVATLAAEGQVRVANVRYSTYGGATGSLPVDLLLLHQGVIPSINLSNAIGCRHEWDDRLLAWKPQVDEWGTSSVPGIMIAGDGAGIAGALAAEARGRLAALRAATALGHKDTAGLDRLARLQRAALASASRGRAFFDTLYQPPARFRMPDMGTENSTLVCRCEEVTAQEVVDAVELGCVGPNQLKSFLRCGMGPCQGRSCGPTVVEMIARERGVRPQDVGYYRLRFPTKPLTLGELAGLPQTAESQRAVIRLPGS